MSPQPYKRQRPPKAARSGRRARSRDDRRHQLTHLPGVPRQRKLKLRRPGAGCPHPEKRHHRTRDAAEAARSMMTQLTAPDALHAYRCPCGAGWCLTKLAQP